jgi:hypothetical protein
MYIDCVVHRGKNVQNERGRCGIFCEKIDGREHELIKNVAMGYGLGTTCLWGMRYGMILITS